MVSTGIKPEAQSTRKNLHPNDERAPGGRAKAFDNGTKPAIRSTCRGWAFVLSVPRSEMAGGHSPIASALHLRQRTRHKRQARGRPPVMLRRERPGTDPGREINRSAIHAIPSANGQRRRAGQASAPRSELPQRQPRAGLSDESCDHLTDDNREQPRHKDDDGRHSPVVVGWVPEGV